MPEQVEQPQVNSAEVTPALLQEARQLGWVPQEEFRGDKARWVDAETFVQRGHEIMPLLKANNSRLLEELNSTREQLRQASDAIAQLQTASAEITKERVTAVRKELMAGIRTAREEGDVEKEDQLTDKLAELRAAEKAPVVKPVPAPEAPLIDPAFTTWAASPENSWFGRDKRKTALAMAVAEELRSDPSNKMLVGLPFYDRVAREVEIVLNPPPPPRSDRVEGSRGGAGGSGGSKSGYNALPADAKLICDRQASQFVGKPGFKDEAAWRSYYAKVYFGDQE